MNREIFIYARKAAKDIHEESKSILPDHRLVFHETTIGFELSQFWDGWSPYLTGINFGSHKLSRKQVNQIINDNEQLEFL